MPVAAGVPVPDPTVIAAASTAAVRPAEQIARQAPPSPHGAGYLRLCGLLRDIRAEAQDLQTSLKELLQKVSLTDTDVRAREIRNAQAASLLVLARNRAQVEDRIGQIRALFQNDDRQYDWCGDEVIHIENHWRRALDAWPVPESPAEHALQRVGRSDACLDQVIYYCASLTIAGRLNDLLANLRIGQPLDFHRAFEDELPKREQRVRVLDDLARQPDIIQGVVDVDKGVVYRASPSTARRQLSALLVVGAALIGFPVIALVTHLGNWLSLAGWPIQPDMFPSLAVGYLFLLLGSVAHVVIDALKQSRAGGQTMIALEDWLLWIHVREGSLLWGVLYLWVGFGFVAASMRGMSWQTGFFTGYSIDSVVDLFLDRFQKATGEKTAQLKAQLG